MEVTALCTTLMVNVLMLQITCWALKDVFPRVLPNRLQFFEYESVSLHCDFGDSAEWRVTRTLVVPSNVSTWRTSAGWGSIKPAYSADSGEYWCEDGDGLRSNAVNITVTAGPVVLESPALPVREGDDVTLSCKKKGSHDGLIAEFYKDGQRVATGYRGDMTIYNVSTSDEGLYRCNISGAGGSAESRLAVTEPNEETRPPDDPSDDPSDGPPDLLTPLCVGISFFLLALLLLMLGVLHRRKCKGGTTTATGADDAADPDNVTYAVVNKTRKKKVTGSEDVVDPHDVTYASVKRKEKEPKGSKTGTNRRLPEESAFIYSTVGFPVGH